MHTFLLSLHNIARWLVIIFALIALIRTYSGWFGKKNWTSGDNRAGLLYTIVLDIRDTIQKNSINLFPMRQRSVPLDNTQLKIYIDMARNENKTLLFYDAVGKQVRWLQYYLEEEGAENYYFMKGGAKAFLAY